jgi:hypothetical protein
MTTLKEFEEALREQGMGMALAILEKLRERDRAMRTVAPPRRVRGTKMTPDLARMILELHEATEMTQQEIAFKLGVNQGRVNEVVKRGKWLTDDPNAAEATKRDRALARARSQSRHSNLYSPRRTQAGQSNRSRSSRNQAQLTLGEF